MIKVRATQDDSGHWYVIPEELSEEFYKLLEKVYSDDYPHRYDDEEKFESKFSGYRTGGDLNNIQLYAELK